MEFENKSKEEIINRLKDENKKVTSQVILEQTKNKIKMETLEKQVNTLNEELEEKNNLIDELEIKVEKSQKEMEQIQKKIKEQTEIIKKKMEKRKNESDNQNKILNEKINELKEKNDKMLKEKEALNLEIKTLQSSINARAEEDLRKQEQMELLLNKGYDEKDSINELRKKNFNLRIQLKENQDTMKRALDCVKKAQYFDNMNIYGKILVQKFQPSNNEEQEAINKLNFLFKDIENMSKNYKGFEKANDINIEGSEKNKNFLQKLWS